MNKKLLSIAYIALMLYTIHPSFAAEEMTIFGDSAKSFTDTEDKIVILKPNPNEIAVLNISKAGIKPQRAILSDTPDTADYLKTVFLRNGFCITVPVFSSTSRTAEWEGSIVGKNNISISADDFRIKKLTIFGTNGNVTLSFNNPKSLIKSITLGTSDIPITSRGEELHIGSIWGSFNGELSSEPQLIHILGYSLIEVEINPEAIAD
ncbi:hypothetical protein [Candidatus Bodocaedibacter vickermanii]|uniref:Uncharacterized protein n=1 Tax=Candidatus Bodocaedibacter vickermanii TaxID=2741701 RepID=A0A7L9RUS8_9PROT|nr:hypothetical protein CPBP_01159 [Candidatus Paracaedibacteraceae bacterium 'Lake Konstanz']